MPPLPRSSRQIAFWDASASTRTFAHPLELGSALDRLPPGARVLDVGCGQGRCLGELPPGLRAVGVDGSREMLARARARSGAPVVRAQTRLARVSGPRPPSSSRRVWSWPTPAGAA